MTTDEKSLPIKIEKMSKNFIQGDVKVSALKEISLSVEKGEFVAIMGASGSGKSTLLHLIAGLTQPDEGTIQIEGQNIDQMDDTTLTQFRRRRIGLVFQSFNLVTSLSAEDNILLPLLCENPAKATSELALRLLTQVGLSERRAHHPDALSGGEQQRVAIARALSTDPALILADEPTGSLDSINGQKICSLLRTLCEKEGRTIVLVTHEPSVAVWAQRTVVLQDGEILSEFKNSEFKDAQSLALHYQQIVNSGIATIEVN